MSDMSVLSHEYKTASELSRSISNALIILKKVYYRLPGIEEVASEEFDSSVRGIADILTALVDLLKAPRTQDVASANTMPIPEAFVVRLQTERRGDFTYYLDDLSHLAARLRKEPLQLSDEDITLLDQLAMVADAEASSVYRRLMRM